ncbi:MAG: glycosyltransferase [Oscillospiraceae bacterium]|nr:glycosyltransferase [Oscillospiraceae bacterium]
MDGEITVSVIVLAYNCEKTIAQTLESILSQETSFTFEILVGNDASEDRTGQIAAQFAAACPTRVFCVDRASNVGASYNAYDLLLRCRGKYLAFCEGDDYWLDAHKLQKQVEYLEAHPEKIGCTHRCLLVDDAGRPLRRQRLPWVRVKERFTFRDFSGGRFLPGQTATVVKRNIFRGDAEDWTLLYRCSRHISDRVSTEMYLLRGDFGRVPGTLSAYRMKSVHGGQNLTSRQFKDNPRKCEDELRMTEALEAYASEKLGRAVRFTKKRSDILRGALVRALRTRRPGDAAFARALAKESRAGEWLFLPVSFASALIDRIF